MPSKRRHGRAVGLLIHAAGAAASIALCGAGPALATVDIELPNGQTIVSPAVQVSDIVHKTVPGSPTAYVMWNEHTADGVVRMYSATLDGAVYSEPRQLERTLELRYASFDPTAGEPPVPDALAAGADTRLWVVQFDIPPLPAFRKGVTDTGAQVHQFLPFNAYIVRVPDDEARRAIAALPFVRAVVAYHPAYRLDETIREKMFPLDAADGARSKGDKAPGASRKYHVQLVNRAMTYKQPVADAIRAAGGRIDNLPVGDRIITATLTREQLAGVLRLDQVLWVDEWTPVGTDMDLVRQIGGANWVRDNLGFTGQGVRGEVIDIGMRTTHLDFQNPPPIIHGSQSGDQSHGTSTFGIVFGKGTVNPAGTGMLPGAEQGFFADWDLTPDRWTAVQQLVDPAGIYRCVLQSASVGNTQTTAYTSVSATMDDAIFDHDLLMCQSQSNTGSQSSRPQAWAKNIVSVGAVNHYNNVLLTDDCWCNGASIGPAADGRIKPDLCFYYEAIFTTSSASNQSYTTSFGGTSAATPITAGHFGLLFQMWHEGVFPNHGGGESVFDDRPKSTTAKALMINTARQYPFSPQNQTNNRFRQGWGLPNVQDLYQIGSTAYVVDESQVLAPLGTVSYQFNVATGAPFFKTTMIYRDIAGTTSSSIHRINDLDLKVISPSGAVYWGNSGAAQGPWTTAGGLRNTRDTVENVFVQNPEGGVWTVTVLAAEVPQDSHVESAAIDADFALVSTGGTILSCPADWNNDSVVNSTDVADYLNDWFSDQANGTSSADLDGNSISNSTDVSIMIMRYFSGC